MKSAQLQKKVETETTVTEDDGNEADQPEVEVTVAPGEEKTENITSEPVVEGDIPEGR